MSVVNPDPEVRSSRRVQSAASYGSVRPDPQIIICHWSVYRYGNLEHTQKMYTFTLHTSHYFHMNLYYFSHLGTLFHMSDSPNVKIHVSTVVIYITHVPKGECNYKQTMLQFPLQLNKDAVLCYMKCDHKVPDKL